MRKPLDTRMDKAFVEIPVFPAAGAIGHGRRGLVAYFAFTFPCGVLDDDYPAPGIRQMVSIAYEFSVLSGCRPNRKYSLDFHYYEVPLALGALAMLVGVLAAAAPGFRRRDRIMTLLAAAALFGGVEVLMLCAASGKQLDVRHLAALVPLFLLALMALVRNASPRASVASLTLLGVDPVNRVHK